MELDRGFRDELARAFEDPKLEQDLRVTILDLLERMSGIVQDGFDVLRRGLFDGEEQSGMGSMLGTREPITLIPGTDAVPCRKVALALAQGSGARSKHGFTKVMRAVRSHLITCVGTTKVVILLTDTWDPKLTNESHSDIAAHKARGHLVLPVLVSGGKMSLLHWY